MDNLPAKRFTAPQLEDGRIDVEAWINGVGSMVDNKAVPVADGGDVAMEQEFLEQVEVRLHCLGRRGADGEGVRRILRMRWYQRLRGRRLTPQLSIARSVVFLIFLFRSGWLSDSLCQDVSMWAPSSPPIESPTSPPRTRDTPGATAPSSSRAARLAVLTSSSAVEGALPRAAPTTAQIGRASCRERVS